MRKLYEITTNPSISTIFEKPHGRKFLVEKEDMSGE
jgi:hypothetical protein